MLRVLSFIFFFLTLSFATQAAVTTGPISNATILAYKPVASLDTIGLSRINVPVLAGETAGMATVSTRAAAGRLLAAAGRGVLGPWGMAAITAAQLCYSETDWKICHSTIDPILPISIDTSGIIPATTATTYKYSATVQYSSCPTQYSSSTISTSDAAQKVCNLIATVINGSCNSSTNNYNFVQSSSGSCSFSAYAKVGGAYSYNTTVPSVFYWFGVETTCPSGYVRTNSSGAPMAVSGMSCTPSTAYSCPANYLRSDSYGNLGDDGVFCSYQAPVLTQQQQQDILAPYLLNYYANQLFSDTAGKPLPDIFADADTTFDPTVTPADMPMTWTQLTNYVDWYTSGKAQTTNPLAQYYVSPTNYEYVQNYVNTTNQTNTNTNSSTNVNPVNTVSSSGMTQAQFEESSQKLDTASATAVNATDTSQLDNLTQTSGFDGANDQLTNISNGDIGDLPLLPTPNLPGYSSCQTLDVSWKGHAAVFPSPSQCQKMEEAKSAFGYILYLITFIGLVWEVLRRVE